MIKVQLKPLETETLIFNKGWSRQQLANESGIAMLTLAKVLNGAPCRITTALKIAAALNTDVKKIIVESAADAQRAGSVTSEAETAETATR